MAKSKFIFSTGLESREGKLSFDDSTGNLTLTGSTVFSGSVKAHYSPSADEDLVTVAYLNTQISDNDQLSELNDISITDIDDAQMLVYSSASNPADSYWKNVAMSGDATMAANGAITISAGAIENDMLAGSITNAKLANSAITVTAGDGLSGGGSVSLGETVSLAIEVDGSTIEIYSDTLRIPDSGVVTAKIADSNVTTAKIANLAVNTDKLAATSVTAAKLATDAVTTAKILDSNVTTAKIADLNVTTIKINDAAITTAKLSGSSVTEAKIADLNVTRAKIANDAINGDKIADDAVDSEHIKDGAVLRAAIADDAVNADKLADTDVIAGAYGAATGSVSLTVDAQGRLTAASHQDLSVSHLDTDDLSEGSSNLYFTDARAQAAFSGSTGVTISNGTASIGQDVATDSDVQFANITAVSGTLSGDLTISGDLTVNGDTVTVSTTNMVVEDSLIELSNGLTGAAANDAGFIIERGTTGDNAALIWDESEARFMMGTTTATGDSTGNLTVDVGTLNANLVGDVTGDVTGSITGNAGTATKLKTARTLSISGDAAGSVSFDGSADADIEITIGDDSVTADMLAHTDVIAGDYGAATGSVSFSVDAQGRLTAASQQNLSVSHLNTGHLAEGSNLYFTNARAQDAITVVDAGGDGSLAYTDGTLTYTGPSATEVRAHFSAEKGVALSSGTASLDMDSLDSETVSPSSGDSFAFIDESDNSTKQATLSSLISGSAGTGLVYDAATATLKLDTSGDGAVGGISAGTNIGVSQTGDTVTVSVQDSIDLAGTLDVTGDATFDSNVTVAGDLYVQGTTVSVESTEVKIADATLVIASGSSNASLAAANGAGLKIGSEDSPLASIIYDGADSFDVSDHMNLSSGNEFRINDASILSVTELGSSVISSSLQTLGTISTGVWQGTPIANAYLADNAVTTAKIVNGNVTTDKLAADAVTNAKLANMTQGTVKVGGASDAPTDLDASGDGKILVGDGTDVNSVAISGDISMTNAGVVSISSNAVTNDMLSGSIANDKLVNSTISGVALGGTLGQLSKATNSGLAMSNYDGSAAVSDLAIDMNDLAAAEVNVANDSIAIIDADASNGSRKESIADLMSAVAGSGLAASNGVLSLDTSSGAVQTIDGTENEVEVSRTGATVTVGLPNNVTLAGDLTAVSASLSGDLTVSGDLLVSGETVTVNASEVVIEDKTLVVASGASDAEIATANGAGLKIGNESSPLASILYDGSDSFDVTDHMNLSSGNEFKINDVSILSATELGSSVISSSLQTLGTISTGVWNGTAIATAYIANDAINGDKIADDAVASEHIADGAVLRAAIADDAVNADKLADTDVIAGAYGAATGSVSLTVDAQGRLTAASHQNLSISHLNTSHLAEDSTNKYFTDARAQDAITVVDAGGDGSLAYSGGTLTYTGPSAAEVRAHFAGGTGVTINEGTASIGQAVGTTDDVSFNKVTVSGSAGEHVISMYQASMIVKEVASMTSGSVVDSFDASSGGSAEYLISAKDANGNMQTNKLLVASDGTSSYVVEYGDVDSSGASGFIEFTSDVSGGNARLLINSNSSGGAVTVRFHKVEVLY